MLQAIGTNSLDHCFTSPPYLSPTSSPEFPAALPFALSLSKTRNKSLCPKIIGWTRSTTLTVDHANQSPTRVKRKGLRTVLISSPTPFDIHSPASPFSDRWRPRHPNLTTPDLESDARSNQEKGNQKKKKKRKGPKIPHRLLASSFLAAPSHPTGIRPEIKNPTSGPLPLSWRWPGASASQLRGMGAKTAPSPPLGSARPAPSSVTAPSSSAGPQVSGSHLPRGFSSSTACACCHSPLLPALTAASCAPSSLV